MVDGRAVVFLGDKGAGKSTTAGAFVAAGHQLISDDIIAIPNDTARPVVQAAFPLLKLSPAALEAFGTHHFEMIPNPTAHDVKHRLIPHTGVPQAPVPIAAIYQLVRGMNDDTPRTIALNPAASLTLLMEHSYMARYGKEAFREPGEMAGHLAACGRLVRETRIARLTVPSDIRALTETVACVRADARAVDDDIA